MGQKAKKDEIYFNYPIPRDLHKRMKLFSVETGMSVKDIVVSALEDYLSQNEDDIDDIDAEDWYR